MPEPNDLIKSPIHNRRQRDQNAKNREKGEMGNKTNNIANNQSINPNKNVETLNNVKEPYNHENTF